MRIEFHSFFKKRYKKIPYKIRKKFDERFLIFEKEPFHPILNNHRLSGQQENQRSINITSDWRAVYVFKDKDIVVFVDIDTHSNLYS